MDGEDLREDAERDQLWASMRPLLPEMERMAGGAFDGTDRERQLAILLARVTVAELGFRARRNPA